MKLDHDAEQELRQESQWELQQELQGELEGELQRELNNPTMYSGILHKIMKVSLSRKEISEEFGQKKISGQLEKIISKLIEDKLIENTIPENKNHPKQKLRITKRGITFLELLRK